MSGLGQRKLEAELIAELPERRALSVLKTGVSGSGVSGVSGSNNFQGVQQGNQSTQLVPPDATGALGDPNSEATAMASNALGSFGLPITIP